MYKPKFFSVNSSMIRLTWEAPTSLNGPAPLYSVEKTVPSLSYPPMVVQGTRFPGGGYYLFPPDIIPPNVAFTGKFLWIYPRWGPVVFKRFIQSCTNYMTGIRLKFKTKQRNGLLLFAASAGRQEEFLVLQFKSGRPWFIFDPQGQFYSKGFTLRFMTTE